MILTEALPLPFESMGGAMERLGVAGILVLAGAWLVKYFIAQLALKDARNNDLADRFVSVTEKMTVAIQSNAAEQQRMAAVIDKLAVAVDRLQERRVHQRDDK